MRPDHLLEIGSISKSFAAIVALQLSAEGLLDLHAPITDYLPWFEVQSEFEPITTHHLLTHTAGLVTGSLGFYDGRAEVWALRRTQTGTPPGTFFHYSNSGYETVGLIVTAVTGEPFHEELRRRVLAPLDMTSSEPNFTNEVRPRLAVGHTPATDDRPFIPGTSLLAPATWFVGDTADGAICATAEDMARYLRLWLSGGGGAYDGVLTREGFRTMTTPAIEPIDRGDEGYGYGIGITSVDGRTVFQHSGGMVGYVAQAIAEFDAGLGVIVLANGPAAVHAIAREAMDQILSERSIVPVPPPTEPSARDEVPEADRLAGEYHGPHGDLTVEASGTSLTLRHTNGVLALRRTSREGLIFVVDDPVLGLAQLEFANHDGGGVTLVHGQRWYAGPGYEGPTTTDHPSEWDRYAGLYRAHNPWNTCLRFVVRHGEFWVVYPGSGGGERLEPDGVAAFRPVDERLPERVLFHSFAEGIPISVQVEGFDYYRAADPDSCWNDTRPEKRGIK